MGCLMVASNQDRMKVGRCICKVYAGLYAHGSMLLPLPHQRVRSNRHYELTSLRATTYELTQRGLRKQFRY
jgi:hypothetical protein